MAAVTQNGDALRYASEELKADKEVRWLPDGDDLNFPFFTARTHTHKVPPKFRILL